jgi:hypothetical protein
MSPRGSFERFQSRHPPFPGFAWRTVDVVVIFFLFSRPGQPLQRQPSPSPHGLSVDVVVVVDVVVIFRVPVLLITA